MGPNQLISVVSIGLTHSYLVDSSTLSWILEARDTMTELNNPANCERFPFPGCLINLTFKQLVIISRHLVAVSRWPYVRSIHNVPLDVLVEAF